MHTKGKYKNRVHFSNGDFTEGFQFNDSKLNIETDWIDTFEIFPIVKRGINKDYTETRVKDRAGNIHLLSSEECFDITNHWVNEITGIVEGSSLDKKIQYLNQNLNNLILIPFNQEGLNKLKRLNLI